MKDFAEEFVDFFNPNCGARVKLPVFWDAAPCIPGETDQNFSTYRHDDRGQ
jgi:hypothetical protein